MIEEYPHTITFQLANKASDGGGGSETITWTDFLTTEAFVCPISGRELMQAQQMQNPIDHSVFYPYQEGVKSDMRIKWHDRNDALLDIRSKPLDQGGQGEILMVKAQLK